MTVLQYIYIYLLPVPVFFLIDMVWLGYVANSFYQTKLVNFLGPVNWTAAIVFYLLYIIGILIFAKKSFAKENYFRKIKFIFWEVITSIPTVMNALRTKCMYLIPYQTAF